MKLAVFLANGFEEVEAVTVIDYLRRAGVEVSVVGVTPPDSVATTIGTHDVKIIPDISLNDYLAQNTQNLPDAIYLPGGMPGAENLANNQDLMNFIETCFKADKIIAAICAAPVVVLAKAGILEGKKFTCYPGMQGDLPNYVADSPVVVDEKVITGAGPDYAMQFANELIRLIKTI